MQNFDTKQFTEQLESMFFAPARAYATLSVDFTEKLANAQLEAGKTYSEISLAQLRSLLDVKDSEGLRSYLEDQQKVAKDLTDRLKGDTEKVVALHQDFVEQSQKLTESNVKQVSAAVESNVKQVSDAAENSIKQVTEAAEDTAKPATASAAKSKAAK
jgi:phasin family protein